MRDGCPLQMRLWIQRGRGVNGSVSKSANDAPKAVDVNAKINMTKFMRARYLFGIKTWNRNEKYAVNW